MFSISNLKVYFVMKEKFITYEGKFEVTLDI